MANNIDKKALGLRIRAIRQEKGMTLEEFGKLFGAGKGLVSRWENGLSVPSPERIKLIAKVGDKTVDELLYGDIFFYLFSKFKESIPKEKGYLTDVPVSVIIKAKEKIDELNISLSDDKSITTIMNEIITLADESFNNTIMLYVKTIKDNWDVFPKISERLPDFWEEGKNKGDKLENFKKVIYSDNKNIYSQNEKYIESYYYVLDSYLNKNIDFSEAYLYTVKLEDFDINKDITEYKQEPFFFPALSSFVSSHDDTALGIYSPKEQALYISEWCKEDYKKNLYSKKYCVVYNHKLYATELLEDDSFLIDNQRISIENVYYFAPLVAILY